MNNNTKEDYCSLEVSRLLKEKGFRVPTNQYFIEKYYAEILNKNRENMGSEERFTEGDIRSQQNKHCKGRLVDRNQYDTTTSRPTHAIAIKWIRENFNLSLIALPYTSAENPSEFTWIWMIHKIKSSTLDKVFFNSPEEATEAVLLYALKNIIK